MQAIINFLRGSVLFTVTGAFPERFLNLCAQAGVGFWDLEWLDPHTLRLRVSRRDARRVGPLAEKVLCEARARRHLGFPYFLAGFRKRYALLLGLALSLAAVCLLSRFVLTIEVSGNETVSTAAILYPALLVTMMRESHRPDTGLVTGLCVVMMRLALDLAAGMPPGEALRMEYPGGVFYLCYDCVLCLLIRDRRTASLGRMGAAFLVSDFISNVINLYLSSGVRGLETEARALLPLIGLAVARSFTAAMILWGSRYYHRLLLRQEHERRYQRLFLMTAELKNELYFLKKNSDDIEQVMTNAYRLYERLGEKEGESGELSALALSIARDVEVKKDNLRIIRGIEGEVEEVYEKGVFTFTPTFGSPLPEKLDLGDDTE